jgi:hypothetical protein
LQIVIIFILGKEIYGKKHPVLIFGLAENLSIDPKIRQPPSGSIMNAILGLDNWWLIHVGAASIKPPTLQKDCMYSFQFLYNDGIAT